MRDDLGWPNQGAVIHIASTGLSWTHFELCLLLGARSVATARCRSTKATRTTWASETVDAVQAAKGVDMDAGS